MPKATQEVMEAARKELQAAQGFNDQLRKEYSAEENGPIYLSPMYAAYFGKAVDNFHHLYPKFALDIVEGEFGIFHHIVQ